MDFLIVLVILCLVVLFVSAPLRRIPRPGAHEESADDVRTDAELRELEAARQAKYREIRDAELDHRTGKLSNADYEAIDGQLRAEAIEIMHEIDRAHAREQQPA